MGGVISNLAEKESYITQPRVHHNTNVPTTANATNDNFKPKTLKELLIMSLHLLPIIDTIPSWQKDAFSSNDPSRATITYNHCDNAWELRCKKGSLIASHRYRDEMIVELQIWQQVWTSVGKIIR